VFPVVVFAASSLLKETADRLGALLDNGWHLRQGEELMELIPLG
jgi:hypothetical protein